MKYGLLIVLIVALGYGAKWSIETLDNAILITDYWLSETANGNWKLVSFQNDEPKLYDFQNHQTFSGIAKALWPVFGTFALGLIILPFLATYIYRSAINLEIQAALKAKDQAIENQRTSEKEAQTFKLESKKWAEDSVKAANDKAYKDVHQQFEAKYNKLRQQERSLIERENSVVEREGKISELERSAQDQVQHIKAQYEKELERFESEKATYTKSRKNAVAAMNRRKRKDKSMQ
ncbi:MULTISPECIES: hypothetical protein [Vibrio]|uniref:hypothetical protein n=1 Tax=Vibrio TaxID=662 RepID=UPI000C8320A6|nr:hypothetical protein [Vibrio cyclitrophicus]PMI45602.1 hypothetical protein BCU44_12055 [Vibrio cyclitrophicus]